MEYVNLGRSGLKVSRICLGTLTLGTPDWRPWVLDERASRPLIRRALDAGITFFDTADKYSLGVSEEVVGRALGDMAARADVVIATKVYFPMSDDPNDRGLSRRHIMQSIDASLRRLGTDHVDIYYVHRDDPETPIEETLAALDDVVRSGKARYIGASSMAAWRFATALRVADANTWTRFIVMQNHYNLLYREEEREMSPLCLAEGVGVAPYCPLACGMLAGNRTREGERKTARAKGDDLADELYGGPVDFDIAERVAEIAERRGVSPAEVALAWLLDQQAVTAPVVGVSRARHIDQAVAALDITLAADECAYLEAPYRPKPVTY